MSTSSGEESSAQVATAKDESAPPRASAPLWSPSKITPPASLGATANHKRIFARMDGAANSPIVWLQGPPGAGKTTLIVNWLAARGVTPIWQRLDPEDSDPSTFFFYLSRADALNRAETSSRLPLLTPAYQHGLGAFSRGFFRKLFDDPTPRTLVFDDYQQVDGPSAVHDCLSQGMEELPRHARIVVISRTAPPREFARLRVNGHMNVVEPEALRVSSDEAAAIARGRDLSFDEATLNRLTEASQGWVAGLILMMEAERSGATPTSGPAESLPELLFDYFAHEVFRRFEEREKNALMISAVMPTITATSAQLLSGFEGAGALLERLARENYFTVRDNELHPNYRFHPLFRGFLEHCAERALSEDARRQVNIRAAEILDREAQPDAAAALLRRCAEWRRLAELIKLWASRLESSGRQKVLSSWLDALPSEILNNDGWLSYWAAAAQAPFAYQSSFPHYRRALELLASDGDASGVLLAGAGLLDAISGDHFTDRAELDSVLTFLRGFLADLKAFPSVWIEYRFSISMYGALGYRSNDREEIEQWRHRAMAAAERPGSPVPKGFSQIVMAIHGSVDGDFHRVREWAAAMPSPQAMREAPDLQSLCSLATIIAQSHRQAPGSVFETAENALRDADRTGVRGFAFLQATYAATDALRRGDADVARLWASRIGERMDQISQRKGAFYYFISCGVALLDRDIPLALRHGRRAVQIAGETNYRYAEGVSRLYLAQTLMEVGDLVGAGEQIQSIAEILRSSASGSLTLPYQLLQAEYLARSDREAEALALLREGLAEAEDGGVSRAYLMPPLAQHVLSRALRQEIAPDYVRQLILNDELPPPRERFAEWPWPVRVRALGDFAILRSEETLSHSRKPPRRLLALLKAIVALGGVNVPQNHVIDAVWPLADGDAAARSFEAAIHRLRGLLGSPRALTLHEGMVSLNPELCWIDACEFEAALAPRQPSTEALEHALRLYRGDFFVNEPDLTIADPRRRALRAKFVLAQRRLAERRESKVGGGAAPSPRLRAPVASTAKREAHS